MSDDDAEGEDGDEDGGPAVELGEGPLVEGAPLARVASRLSWPIERSRLLEREGEAVVRTPDGPRELSAVLEAADVTYFDTRRTFVETVRAEVGDGPVETAADGSAPDGEGTDPVDADAAAPVTTDDDGATAGADPNGSSDDDGTDEPSDGDGTETPTGDGGDVTDGDGGDE